MRCQRLTHPLPIRHLPMYCRRRWHGSNAASNACRTNPHASGIASKCRCAALHVWLLSRVFALANLCLRLCNTEWPAVDSFADGLCGSIAQIAQTDEELLSWVLQRPCSVQLLSACLLSASVQMKHDKSSCRTSDLANWA